MKQSPAPGRPHFVSRFGTLLRRAFIRVLARYFSIVPLPESFAAIAANPRGTTVVTESSSLIIEALLYSFARRGGLKDSIHLGTQSARARSDETLYWVGHFEEEALRAIVSAEPTQRFVTLNIFSGRGPFRHNPYFRLGFWDLFGILIMGRFLIILFGSPIIASPTHSSIRSALTRQLRLDFYKNLKLVRGTPFQSIETQARVVMGGAEFAAELQALSEKLGVPVSKLKRQAKHAFYTIAANPRRPMYRIVAFAARVLTRRLFSTVRTAGMDRLIPAVRNSTVVIVPMHRSHLDYILLGSILYDSKLNPPLVAAGINLSFWPAGFIIRSVGGYFVKRNVRQDRLHALLLKRYVAYLVKRGYLQEFFIEGGRSRSGKMRQPKVGLLSIFMEAHRKGDKRDIVFVPVSITYENVIEDSVFGQENTGRSKERESFFSLLKARKIFGQKYGDVVVNFGQPIPVNAGPAGPATTTSRREQRSEVIELAHRITFSIREHSNPSLTSLAHTALLLAPHYGLRREALIRSIQNLGSLISMLRPAHPLRGECTPSLEHFLSGRENILYDIARGNSIRIQRCASTEVFFIPGERRFVADFYKNATVHLFFNAALLAILDLLGEDLSLEGARPFYRIFSNDFLLGEPERFEREFAATLTLLTQHGVLRQDGSRTTFRSREIGLFIPALLLPSIESLLWTMHHLFDSHRERTELSERSGEVHSLDYDPLLAAMHSQFRSAVYLGLTHCTEASSLASLSASLDTLSHLGVITITDRSGKRSRIQLQRTSFPELTLLVRAYHSIREWQHTDDSSYPTFKALSSIADS